jgi:hypothetical protein
LSISSPTLSPSTSTFFLTKYIMENNNNDHNMSEGQVVESIESEPPPAPDPVYAFGADALPEDMHQLTGSEAAQQLQNTRPTPPPHQQFQQLPQLPQFQQFPQQRQQQQQWQFPQFNPPHAPMNPHINWPAGDSVSASNRGREDQAPGQISLVERLHNVHERTASPAKRPRTDDDGNHIDSKKPHINLRGGGHGGALDLQNNKPTAVRATQGPPIDLTMSDNEEEVKITKDNSDQLICIGRPKNCYVQSHTVPFPDPKKYHGNHGHRGRLKVNFRRGGGRDNIIMVVDPSGKEFGRMDHISAQYIAPLMDGAKATGLMWSAWTEPRMIFPFIAHSRVLLSVGNRNQDNGPPGSPSSALIGLTMQLYCPRRAANGIGKFLTARKQILLDPLWDLQRHDYFNPQTHATLLADIAQPTFEPPAARYGAGGVGSNYVLRSVDEIRSDVENM